jgi:hypothetical protein
MRCPEPVDASQHCKFIDCVPSGMPFEIEREDPIPQDTLEDMERRKSMIRTDNMEWIEKVKAARSLIYEGKKAVDNKKDVESLLKADSLVPTIVSYHFYHFFSTGPVLNLRLERFF